MRKKKLIARISELESEVSRLKDNEDLWKDMIMRFVEGLHEHGVKVGIVLPEPPTAEWEDPISGVMYRMPGKRDNWGEIELRFDFTEHDEKVKKREV